MVKLLIATTNPAKLAETSASLNGENIEVMSLKDFSKIVPVEENGRTFEENAVLKAKGYYEQTKIPTLADDGGLIVDALGGAPGVASHRWLGYDADDRALAQGVIEKLKGIPWEKRTARLGTCFVFWDGEHLLTADSWVEGHIAEKLVAEIRPGFPYRSVFLIDEFNKPYAELTEDEHQRVNFRKKNIAILKPQILEYLQK